MKVNEIFVSIEGEGKRAGELATFIRLTGCNLRCSYCDTAYAFEEGTEMSVPDILKQVPEGIPNVTLTGGEPLCQEPHELLGALRHHMVNIETNGSVDLAPYRKYSNVFFTVDYKCPTSGMESRMLEQNFLHLRPGDVLKFVVGSTGDLETAFDFCREYRPDCQIYISPVFGKIEPAEIVDFMKEKNTVHWRLQLQLHKFIWNPEQRGV